MDTADAASAATAATATAAAAVVAVASGSRGWRWRLAAVVGAFLLPGASGRLRGTANSRTRIINGSAVDAASAYHTFFALPTASAESDSWLGCGASIISPTFALSSAHCFGGGDTPCAGPRRIGVWVGDVRLDSSLGDGTAVAAAPGGRSHRVAAELVCHPSFDGKCSHGDDVALLRLQSRLPDWARPVELDLDHTAVGGEQVTALGYGLTESPEDPTTISVETSAFLRQASVTVLARESPRCARVFAGGYGCSDEASEGAAQNLDTQLCAGSEAGLYRDSCSGDSGSPVLNGASRQVGIVSYGGGPGEKMAGPGRMCGDPEYPGVYARVAAFRDFILANVPDLPAGSRGDEGEGIGDVRNAETSIR